MTKFGGIAPATALLIVLAGCYPRTQSQYGPDMAEQPQLVQYFNGSLIDRRPASFEYSRGGGFGAVALSTSTRYAGLYIGGNGGTGGIGAAFGGVAVLAAGAVPELPATEFTVCLDQGANQAGGPAAVIVVQNDYPDRYDYPDSRQNDSDLQPGTPVQVRVVGNSGRVMRVNRLLASAPANAQCSAANHPISVPLGVPPPSQYASYAPVPEGHVELFPVMVYNPYHSRWTINTTQ